MIINFKEIPKANAGGGHQDQFEQFACDLLETLGYAIIARPDRGPDGKKDIIISETRRGLLNNVTEIKWLVSCKHYAHSGRAVKDIDEPDIVDRVANHGCQGFMGFYSTIPATSLSNKLQSLRSKMECEHFDYTRIEKELLRNKEKYRLLETYFPASYGNYAGQKKHSEEVLSIPVQQPLTEIDVLRITKTAMIILEVDKIKERYLNNMHIDAVERSVLVERLYRFVDHKNELISRVIFEFLELVADQATDDGTWSLSSAIKSLIYTYFPASDLEEQPLRISNGKQCAYIGFNIAYDAFIHSGSLGIAEHGLSILKYIYLKAKKMDIPELTKAVKLQYLEMERHLQRPERNDLQNAKELLQIYKTDLDKESLLPPDLPNHLAVLTLK